MNKIKKNIGQRLEGPLSLHGHGLAESTKEIEISTGNNFSGHCEYIFIKIGC